MLNVYQLKQLFFNDVMQSAGVTMLMGAPRACERVKIPLNDQRIVIGAGSAAVGVVTTLTEGMLREGMTNEEAREHFYVLDQPGLLVSVASR